MDVISVSLFIVMVALTLVITFWAARRNKSASSHYVAEGKIKGWQNGLAISGDYLSASSLLGISGAVALTGFSGFFFSIGALSAFLTVLLLIAEPMRSLGKYTMADTIASRFDTSSIRSVAALSTVIICMFYMVAQLVGAGAIIQLLLGIPYALSVLIIGVLMTIYIVAGGMLATTWIQIIKAVLLMGGTLLLSALVLANFGFNPVALFNEVYANFGDEALGSPPPSGFVAGLSPISQNLALLLGVAGLPHILIRFFTVPDAKTARSSVLTAVWVIGIFYLMMPILGYGALLLIGRDDIVSSNPAGNLAAPQLAQALGGNIFLAFISAVVFVTIVAVVAGLVIAASGAFAHDFYTNVIRGGQVSERAQFRAARIAAVGISVVSILVALSAQSLNIAVLTALTFAVAASANVPVLLLTIFWKGFNTEGAIIGMLIGLVSSVLLVVISPNVMGETAIFPLTSPALVSVPLAFLGCYLGTLIGRRRRSGDRSETRVPYEDIAVRVHTGRPRSEPGA